MALLRIFLPVLLALCLLGGCSQASDAPPQSQGKWKVTATTSIVADLVKQIGGEQVEVTSLMGPGVDPHLYKASQGDIQRIESADIIFYSGLHLEGKMGDILEKIGKTKPVIAVTSSIPQELLLADPSSPDQYDPHVWFDVTLWMKAAETVRDELIKLDPEHEKLYLQNAEKYLTSLQELHDYALAQLSSVPEKQRVLVTAHDAFNYFGRAYGIEVIGLQGISTASEYGLRDVQNLVDLLVKRGIKAVFVESSVPKRSIEAVVEGARAANHTVTIGGELFSDALGGPDTAANTYTGMVKHNVDTIVSALR